MNDRENREALQSMAKVFVRRARRRFRLWVASTPSGFRNSVVAAVKAQLPRARAGRKSNPTVKRANWLYEAQLTNGGSADWKAIAAAVIENYLSLAPTVQRFRRKALQAQVHSYRHQRKQRQTLSQIKKQFTTIAS